MNTGTVAGLIAAAEEMRDALIAVSLFNHSSSEKALRASGVLERTADAVNSALEYREWYQERARKGRILNRRCNKAHLAAIWAKSLAYTNRGSARWEGEYRYIARRAAREHESAYDAAFKMGFVS